MKTLRTKLLALAAVVALSASAALAAPVSEGAQTAGYDQLAKKVRHELVTLPWYGVFDNLEYQIDGSTVTLYGQVVQASTRKDAERRVSRIAGVSRVVNRIEVLPVSPFDDSIRARTYRALFGWNSPLFRYGRGANPSIHIVVDGGHVSLEGVVSNEGDRNLAYMLANGVPGVFSVQNNLQVENVRAR
ncbi:MAG TPA: BON domain-containing protein [Pyrinomonadaceae bacterium]|nr:BON domain-containing protein [Pyrinomonadaceae bacterium]